MNALVVQKMDLWLEIVNCFTVLSVLLIASFA